MIMLVSSRMRTCPHYRFGGQGQGFLCRQVGVLRLYFLYGPTQDFPTHSGINEFGEIISNFEVDQLNEFLNDKVDDKKLRDQTEQNEEKIEEE